MSVELEAQNKSQMQKNIEAQQNDKEVEAKVYHSKFPGSSFILPDGTILLFDHKGELETKSELAQKELDKVSDKPGSPIFAKNSAPIPAPGDSRADEEIKSKAAATVAALKAQQVQAIK